MNGPYKVRETPPGRFCLTLPSALAVAVGQDRRFVVMLTDEGILYRPADMPLDNGLPEWLARPVSPDKEKVSSEE